MKEDEVDRDKLRESVEKQKSVLDIKKRKEKKKNLDRQALEECRAKSRQRGEPEEESPDEDDGGDGNDDSDDSEGMASRLDRILEGPHRADADAPRTRAPKEGPGGSLERQRESSPRRSHADIHLTSAQSRSIPRPQPPPALKAGDRAKPQATGPLTRGCAAASGKGETSSRSTSPGARQAEDAEPRPAPARGAWSLNAGRFEACRSRYRQAVHPPYGVRSSTL